VLITGGDLPGTGSLSSAEIYDPVANTFSVVPSTMTTARVLHSSVLLNGGTVLITGGATHSDSSTSALNTAEVYDPASQTFAPLDDMISARKQQTTALLNDGTMLRTVRCQGICWAPAAGNSFRRPPPQSNM
jgi:hypothetical protein